MTRKITSNPIPGRTNASVFVSTVALAAGATAAGAFAHWTLSLLLTGRCLYSCNGSTFTLEAGDFLLSRPDTFMSWRVLESDSRELWQPYYAIFDPRAHWHDWLNYPETFPGLTVLHLAGTEMFPQVRRHLKAAFRLYQNHGPNRDDFTLLVLERLLLTLHAHYQRDSSRLDERVRRALEFMEAHYQDELTIRAIARAATLSVSQFSLLFSKQMGLTPMQYLENIRLKRASELLRFSSLPISEVAAATGFRDPMYFARRFRLHTNRTPRDFRREARPS